MIFSTKTGFFSRSCFWRNALRKILQLKTVTFRNRVKGG